MQLRTCLPAQVSLVQKRGSKECRTFGSRLLDACCLADVDGKVLFLPELLLSGMYHAGGGLPYFPMSTLRDDPP